MMIVDGKRISALSPEDQAEAKVLYESGISAAKIGARLGVTRNTIAGLAHRKGWHSGSTHPQARVGSRGEEPETLMQRLDRLEAGFNRVMAEYPPGTGRVREPPKERPHAPAHGMRR